MAAIPSLSPREEQWLDEEMREPISERAIKAVESREYSGKKGRLDAKNLDHALREISAEHERAELIRKWLRYSYMLLESDTAYHLARLVTDKVISRKDLPGLQDIILCTLPPLGVGRTIGVIDPP